MELARVNGTRIAYELTGSGFPVVLLHGYPQTRRIWRKMTPGLAARFTVIAMDLRGYGDSDKPAKESLYDKRTMAEDVLALAKTLGYDRFLVMGHDRGGRVARRLAADHPEALSGAVLLDILPLEWVYSQGKDGYAARYWHWYFHLQRGVAEKLISADPRAYASWFFSRSVGRLDPQDVEHYLEAFSRPGCIAATLADYRTAFEIDRPRWEAEITAGNKVAVPLHLLWGELGNLRDADVLGIWRGVARQVTGASIAGSGHYIPEEQPEAVLRHVLEFANRSGLP